MPLKPPTSPTSDALTFTDFFTVVQEAPVNVDDSRFNGDIAAAIAHASSSTKGHVYIPSRVRNLTATTSISAAGSTGLTIFGDGEFSELRLANTAGLIGFDIGPLADRVVIKDLYIKGSTAQGAGLDSHGIRYQENSNYGKVYNVKLDQIGDDAIRFDGCIAPKVEDCFITDSGLTGITLERTTTKTNAAVIRDNWIQSCSTNGLYVARCESATIEGNRFEVNGTDAAGSGNCYLFESLYPVVQNNYFEDGADFDIRYGDGGSGFAVDGTISGNTFQASSAPNAAPRNIWLEASFRTEVMGNKFSSVLSATTNLECGATTNGLKLRKQNFANTATGLVFAANTNTSNGMVESVNAALPSSVSAATTMTLPGWSYVVVTGNTGPITTIPAGHVNRIHVLKFTDAAPPQVTDGGNLLLAGNFVPTQNDTLTLISDGSNWLEVSRSGNI